MSNIDVVGCESGGWKVVDRPGYFGRRRDMMYAKFDADYGKDQWRIAWFSLASRGGGKSVFHQFEEACKLHYETSYVLWFRNNMEEIDKICTYGECIDNAPTNVGSGLDYTKQEAFSTHIQDIAVRNVLAQLGRTFEGPKDKILVIRSQNSDGFKYGPGNVPYYDPASILQPSKCPRWANKGSVEDFWQSNKVLMVKKGSFQGEF